MQQGEGTVPAPSDEAKKAALAALDSTLSDRGARRALAAAYAIDLPRVRAEERAARTAEIVAALREHEAMGIDYRANPDALRPASAYIAAHFNPEAE